MFKLFVIILKVITSNKAANAINSASTYVFSAVDFLGTISVNVGLILAIVFTESLGALINLIN